MADEHSPDRKPLPNRTQYMADMDNFVPPIRPKPILKLLVQGVLILVILAAIAAGAVWLVSHHKHMASAPGNAPSSTQPKPSTNSIDNATKHYDSSDYNLGLDYPADWTVNDNTSELTVTSSALQLKGEGGQNFTGQVVLIIQNQQTSVPVFAKGTAVAALESQKLTYKSPAPDQRAQTYLTFADYEGSTAAIDGLYITGDDGYQAGQAIPMSDIVQDDPLVSISFLKCSDAACSTAGAATTIPASDWQNANFSRPLTQMLESLVLN
ncbi:MAG TPA: hypothetical protein VF261_00815 [Candidatus Saccharimonadales bacterium]